MRDNVRKYEIRSVSVSEFLQITPPLAVNAPIVMNLPACIPELEHEGRTEEFFNQHGGG